MVMTVIKKSWQMLMKKPFLLWGLSLLYMLLCGLACVFGVLPIISIPICLALEAGMIAIYLAAVRGEEYDSEKLFSAFKDFKRVVGGMAWMYLWILIWGLIPGAGIVFAVIKIYTYRFTPYILITHPEVTPTQALKISIEQTKRYRGKMFGADMLVYAAITVAVSVLWGLSLIPYAGYFFLVIMSAAILLICALAPLFYGLMSANFFEAALADINKPVNRCISCGITLPEGAMFCHSCGAKQQ